MRPLLPALLTAFLAMPVIAEEAPPEAAPVPEPPPIPPPVASGEELEPEVTIIETARGTIEEYRVGAHVYMVKVIPSAGPPYYFLDTDGDGRLDAQGTEPTNSWVNQWLLFRW
jgi:hypothetical protein